VLAERPAAEVLRLAVAEEVVVVVVEDQLRRRLRELERRPRAPRHDVVEGVDGEVAVARGRAHDGDAGRAHVDGVQRVVEEVHDRLHAIVRVHADAAGAAAVAAADATDHVVHDVGDDRAADLDVEVQPRCCSTPARRW
jgi:hypothetical protein